MKKKALTSMITVSETGRVGINQPNPEYQLDIRGGVRIEAIGTAAPNAPGIYLISHGNKVDHGGYIGYRHAQAGLPDFDLIQGSMYGKSSPNWNIVVYPMGVQQSGQAAHIALTVDAQGRVGIQQPNPTAQLHVRGQVRFENLPSGEGHPVVVDEYGNLLKGRKKRSKKEITEIETLRASVQRLEGELQQLKELMLKDRT